MTQLKSEELTGLKLSILKDLEKKLKIVYEHQYRNILSKIVSNKKRFVRKHMPLDVSEEICRYNSLATGLTGYLSNLFDVFGESAVLNAKKSFEENGSIWGKKLRKKLLMQDNIIDTCFAVKNLYIDVPGADYMEITENGLVWYLSGLGHSSHPGFYDIKAAWLNSFTSAFSPRYMLIFDKASKNNDATITNIEIKESSY